MIEGTSNALPKRGFVLQGRHPIRIEVLDLISYESFAHKSVEELTAHYNASQAADFAGLGIAFDVYGGTHQAGFVERHEQLFRDLHMSAGRVGPGRLAVVDDEFNR